MKTSMFNHFVFQLDILSLEFNFESNLIFQLINSIHSFETGANSKKAFFKKNSWLVLFCSRNSN